MLVSPSTFHEAIAFQKSISNFVIPIRKFTKSKVKLDVNSKKHQTNLTVIAGLKDIYWTAKNCDCCNNLFSVTTHKIALWRNGLPVQE